MASFPLMYNPKVLPGDTQPWVLAAALFALFTFRVSRPVRRDLLLALLAVICIGTYAARSEINYDLLRVCYTQLTFIVLWLVCRREQGAFFPTAVRLTIIIWFVVAVLQHISLALGVGLGFGPDTHLPITFAGRFVEGRGGVPSLTPEPSTYGGLSMLHIMYLLARKNPNDNPYIACAAASVILSGSLLGLALLMIPILKLKMKMRILMTMSLLVVFVTATYITSAGLISRLSTFNNYSGAASWLRDPSLNLRVGHIYFTLYENVVASLLMIEPIAFMDQYNDFASNSGIFIHTGSNFILPSAGELIYGSGLAGLALLIFFFREARSRCHTRTGRLVRTIFIAACMLNPISLSNPFLLIYAQQRE